MKQHPTRARIARLGAALTILSAGGATAATHPAKPVRPDFTGVWAITGSGMDLQDGTSLENGGRRDPANPTAQPAWRTLPKFKGEYKTKYEQTIASMAKGIPAGGDLESCKPQGMPRFWSGPDALEIIQTPKQLNAYQEWNEQTHRIYLDGRKHPDDWDPTPNGHSVGHWEGDVLVVDTVGLSPDSLVGYNGVGTHSEMLHITERLRKTGPDNFEVELTSTDPKAFEEPWVSRIPYHRKHMEVLPYQCHENLRDPGGFSAGAVRK